MTTMQIHFKSPSGSALSLGSKEAKRSKLPTHGMYRVEIDTKYSFAKQSVQDLLLECFRRLGQGGRLFISVHSSPKTDLGLSYALVGENPTSAIYSVSSGGEISRDVLDVLTALPYGDVVFFEVVGEVNLSQHLQALTDLDGAMQALGGYMRWVVGYDNESAVVSLLAKEKSLVKEQVLAALERNLDSI